MCSLIVLIHVTNQIIVLLCSNCSLSTLNKESKRLSAQMMKFVNLFSKSSLSVLNMVYKHDAATEDIRV